MFDKLSCPIIFAKPKSTAMSISGMNFLGDEFQFDEELESVLWRNYLVSVPVFHQIVAHPRVIFCGATHPHPRAPVP